MTHNDDFIERLETYLDDYEGVTPLPDAVRHAIRAELPRTKQNGPPRGLPRFLSMTLQIPTSARYGLAAAAVLVAVVIGASFLGRNPSVGNPTASPTSSPPPSDTSGSSGPLSLIDAPSAGDLPAGEYYLDLPAFPARIEFDVPEGWWYYWPTSRPETSDVHGILVNSLDTGAANGSGWGLSFTIVNQVRVDPCNPAAGSMESSVTQSADALATAFGAWADFSVTVEDATVGGYRGKRVEITRTEAATCEVATAFSTPHTGYHFDLQTPTSLPVADQFTLLDVEGSVLVIWTTDFSATSPFEVEGGASPDPQAHVADQVELHEILDSIEIQPR